MSVSWRLISLATMSGCLTPQFMFLTCSKRTVRSETVAAQTSLPDERRSWALSLSGSGSGALGSGASAAGSITGCWMGSGSVGSGTSASVLGAAVLPSSTTSQRSFLPSPSSVSPGGACLSTAGRIASRSSSTSTTPQEASPWRRG